MTTTRRGFLAAGAGLAASATLTAPAFARGWDRGADARVVIVGAGLAGLSCADLLHRHGVRARVFEARPDRLGGRCWSSHGWQGGQVAEHGGEFLDSRHSDMLGLAKRFGLGLDDTFDVGGTPRLFIDGRRRRRYRLRPEMAQFERRIVKLARRIGPYTARHHSRLAREIDEMSARDIVDRYLDGGSDSVAGRAYHVHLAGFLGLDLDDLGGLAVIDDLAHPIRGADERWHVHGGNDQIVHGLEDALPQGAVVSDAPLRRVVRRPSGTYALAFGGIANPVHADHVVFCLPFTALREVDLDDSGLSSAKRRCIDELGMGTNAKVSLQLDQRPQRFEGWNGYLAADRPVFETWESSAGQRGAGSVLTVYFGGRSGDQGLPHGAVHGAAPRSTVDAVLRQLTRRGDTDLGGLKASFAGRATIDHWVRDPWTRGSYAAFLPGQYTRYVGVVGEPERRAHFAGEHTSPLANQGYLEGAVRTGRRAAREVLRAVRG